MSGGNGPASLGLAGDNRTALVKMHFPAPKGGKLRPFNGAVSSLVDNNCVDHIITRQPHRSPFRHVTSNLQLPNSLASDHDII